MLPAEPTVRLFLQKGGTDDVKRAEQITYGVIHKSDARREI